MDIDEKMNKLIETVENLKAGGSTVHVHSGDGGGNSSCLIKKTKNGKTYELKVYSNDIEGAHTAVQEAIAQAKVMEEYGDINE